MSTISGDAPITASTRFVSISAGFVLLQFRFIPVPILAGSRFWSVPIRYFLKGWGSEEFVGRLQPKELRKLTELTVLTELLDLMELTELSVLTEFTEFTDDSSDMSIEANTGNTGNAQDGSGGCLTISSPGTPRQYTPVPYEERNFMLLEDEVEQRFRML